jgi:hypothetical protein
MRDSLEEHMLSFIMGGAMMEPDVREQTNRIGFCGRHSSMMLARKNRLALALMLESRLKAIEGAAASRAGLQPRGGKHDRNENVAEDCYICDRVNSALDGLITTFLKLWKKESEFRANVEAQPIICLPHYTLLLSRARAALDKKEVPIFEAAITSVLQGGLQALETDVSGFCKMFDYHNIGAEWGTKKDAPERAIAFLTGYKRQ